MPKIVFFVFSIFMIFTEGHAQKILEKSWDSKHISKLQINSDNVYHIEIISEDTQQIEILMTIEGEHAEQVVLENAVLSNSLQITTGFTPFFEIPNDKLAAHKVLSIEMVVRLPKTMAVEIQGAVVSVESTGPINNLSFQLKGGNAFLRDFKGNATLITHSGNITVLARPGVRGKGTTTYGVLQNNLGETGKFFVRAKSVNGDISLLKDPD